MPTDEQEISQCIGANVRAELARAGKRQDDIAAALHMGQSNLSNRLAGHVSFRVHELVLISRELGVPITRLFDGVV